MYQTSIRKKKKNFNSSNNSNYDINLDYEEYALVKKLLGNCRVNLITNSGDDVIGIIRGNMRKFNKRVLIDKGDFVIVSKREYQINKVDIVHKVSPEEYSTILESDVISNILKNEYYNNSYTTTNENKDTHINFNGSNSENEDDYKNIRRLSIGSDNSESSSDTNIAIENI
jgi:initiation factor 1A